MIDFPDVLGYVLADMSSYYSMAIACLACQFEFWLSLHYQMLMNVGCFGNFQSYEADGRQHQVCPVRMVI